MAWGDGPGRVFPRTWKDGGLPYEDVASNLSLHPQLMGQVHHDRVATISGGKGLLLQHRRVMNEDPHDASLSCSTYR